MTQSEPTVGTWARAIRHRFRGLYSEQKWEGLIHHFAEQISPGNKNEQYCQVMQILGKTQNSKFLQFAIVWLDLSGYGEVSTTTLLDQIYSIKMVEHNFEQKGHKPDQPTPDRSYPKPLLGISTAGDPNTSC